MIKTKLKIKKYISCFWIYSFETFLVSVDKIIYNLIFIIHLQDKLINENFIFLTLDNKRGEIETLEYHIESKNPSDGGKVDIFWFLWKWNKKKIYWYNKKKDSGNFEKKDLAKKNKEYLKSLMNTYKEEIKIK